MPFDPYYYNTVARQQELTHAELHGAEAHAAQVADWIRRLAATADQAAHIRRRAASFGATIQLRRTTR